MSQVYTSFLVLENGCKCQGWSFVNLSYSSYGEIVFNTGMTGYQEIVTDPSYYGQIVMFTYPEIGNTGVNSLDFESNHAYVKGLILKNVCYYPSNWTTEMSLPEYLVKYQIPHIFGIDTRYLTKQLRSQGVMLASITSIASNFLFIKSEISKMRLVQNINPVDKVTTCKTYRWLSKLSQDMYYRAQASMSLQFAYLNVVVVDYGLKLKILEKLRWYRCNLLVVPAYASYEYIVMQKPDGILLSNGPGDPSMLDYAVKNIQRIVKLNIPVFGICLGHQLLSLAAGAKTNKLRFGHRGLNHPSGTLSIAKMTSQNHGYIVTKETQNIISKSHFNICYSNLNDQTVAGIVYSSKPCFSVQYHPEASPGPNDSDYLFAHFSAVMISCKLVNC